MLKIEVRNDNKMKALSAFKTLVNKEGILQMVRERRYYVKPSIAKRLKSERAEKQRKLDESKLIKLALKEFENLDS